MSAPQWQPPLAVVERLLAQPQAFEFFQAVHLLQRWLGRTRGATPAQVLAQYLRFRNSLSMSFPAGEIESLVCHPAEGDDPSGQDGGQERSPPDTIGIVPGFFGLLGVMGVLPHHYTETLAQREIYLRDPSARAFLDIFQNRAVALFYEAWCKHRLHLQYELHREQHFLPLVLAVAGLGQAGLRGRLQPEQAGVADEAVAFHAATLQRGQVSAVQFECLLADYLGVPVRVDSFVGRWYVLPPEARSTLGGLGALGRDAVLGERVWQRDLALRVVLGPLDRPRYRRFLPGGPGERALRHWCVLLLGTRLDVEVQLRLEARAVSGMKLAGEDGAGRLGWESFLLTAPETRDREDVIYDLRLP